MRLNLNFSMSLAGPVERGRIKLLLEQRGFLKQFFLESQLQIEKTFHPQVSVIRGSAFFQPAQSFWGVDPGKYLTSISHAFDFMSIYVFLFIRNRNVRLPILQGQT